LLAPLYVRGILHAPLVAYGWSLTAFAAGGLAAMCYLARRGRVLASPWGVGGFALAAACAEWVFTGTALLPVALAGAALWGASAGMFTVCCRAALVATVAPSRHGRALSWWLGVQNLANVAPVAVAAQAVAAAGLRTVLAGTCAFGTACALGGVTAAWRLPRTRSAMTALLGAARQDS
jgi:hypothetical protein